MQAGRIGVAAHRGTVLMPLPPHALLREPTDQDSNPEDLAASRRSPAISTDFSFRSASFERTPHANLTNPRRAASDRFAGLGPLRRLSLLLMCGDGIVALSAFAAALAPGQSRTAETPGLETPGLWLIAVVAAGLIVGALQGAGAYAPEAHGKPRAQIGRLLLNASAMFASLLALEAATQSPLRLSHASMAIWYLGTIVGLGILRAAAYLCVAHWRRNGRLARVVAVVDVNGMGHALGGRMRRNDSRDMHFLGVYSLRGDSHNGIDALIRVAGVVTVDDIIVAAPDTAMAEVNAVIAHLSATPTNVHVCTSLAECALPDFTSALVLGHPVWTVHRRPLDGWSSVVKRIEDLLLSSLMLILLLPLMTAIAAAIRLDSPGPVLFRQKRLGLGNSVFEILKFRSMTHRPPEHDVPQARRNDPRVTRVGRFLRRTSLDELPQLFNVLKGDMSIVGPRPHALPHNEQFAPVIEGYWGRHRMRPGITGWAQIHGCRGQTETLDKMQRRVNYDLDYIRSWSLLLDLRVLLMTVIVCFLGWESY